MQVHYGFDTIGNIPNPILTIGTFDGVHQGHQKILKRILDEATKFNGESVLFTFDPHPRLVLNPKENDLQLLQTQEEKINKLERIGLHHLIVFPFTLDFSNTKAEDFIIHYLVEKLKVHTIVVGYDHQFGKNREGSLEHLIKLSEKYPFKVIEIPAHEIDEVNVSSTKIRKALQTGDIETANCYLNEAYEISGIVKKGKQLGRTIGYPTANISVSEKHKLIPPTGVYAVTVSIDGKPYEGMLNIGFRPTVSDEKVQTVEVHIFDFSQDIYDQYISVRLLHKIREEQKFASIDALKSQLASDEKTIRHYFVASH